MRHVLWEGLAFAVWGCAGGVVGAALVSRFLESQIYGVHPRDPITFASAIVVIFSGAVLASGIPAYRATTVSPMDALRTD
jgi:ABC-type lipoprotein release transport system permease subunit